MSTAQKNSIDTHEILANDLLTCFKTQMKELKAKHKKKKTTLLNKIQTANTRHKKLESTHQKDVRRLKKKLAKRCSKSLRDLKASFSLDDGFDLDLNDITNTDGCAAAFTGSFETLTKADCPFLYESETVIMQSIATETSSGETEMELWELRETLRRNKGNSWEQLEARWNEETTGNEP
ncbi:hypothetical protein KCU95_g6887, partial [Aureobasidium melanogenum]